MPDRPAGPPRHIRSATTADLAALFALYQHLIPDEAPPAPDQARAIFTQLAAYPGSAVLLALVKDQPVATCTLIVVPNLTRGGAPYALIENVVTHASCRGQGHGTALLKSACSAAWAAGCYKVMLLTGSDDPATHAFYQGAGFTASKTGYQMRRIPARPRP